MRSFVGIAQRRPTGSTSTPTSPDEVGNADAPEVDNAVPDEGEEEEPVYQAIPLSALRGKDLAASLRKKRSGSSAYSFHEGDIDSLVDGNCFDSEEDEGYLLPSAVAEEEEEEEENLCE